MAAIRLPVHPYGRRRLPDAKRSLERPQRSVQGDIRGAPSDGFGHVSAGCPKLKSSPCSQGWLGAPVRRMKPMAVHSVAFGASLDGPPGADAQQAWEAEIANRIDELETGNARTIDADEAVRRIDARLRSGRGRFAENSGETALRCLGGS